MSDDGKHDGRIVAGGHMPDSHHVMPELPLALNRIAPTPPQRPPLPIAPIYDLENPAVQHCATTPAPASTKPARRSMFFGRAAKPDQDPFLQRLARLN